MSRWFRFYDDAVNDPKLIKLPDDLFRFWVNLLCVAAKGDGRLPATDDMAIILRMKPTRAAALITELVAAGLLDKVEAGYSPHNWHGRQYKSDSSAERMKRHRDKKRDVTGDVSSDVTVTVQNRTEQSQSRTDAAPDGAHSASVHPIDSLESQYYRRAHEVLGSRGLGANLLKAKGDLSLARAALEMAATKMDAKEYVGAIIRGKSLDLRERGEAW